MLNGVWLHDESFRQDSVFDMPTMLENDLCIVFAPESNDLVIYVIDLYPQVQEEVHSANMNSSII